VIIVIVIVRILAVIIISIIHLMGMGIIIIKENIKVAVFSLVVDEFSKSIGVV
jgi:hypothetical protein